VRAAPNRKRTGDRGDPDVRGRRTESRVDGGGGGVLERGCEEAEQIGEQDGDWCLLNMLGRAAEGKRGRQGGPVVGDAWRAGTGRKRGPERGGGRLQRLASAPSQWAQAARARAADGWDRTTAGPGGQRLGAGGRGKFILNRFKILQTLTDSKGAFPCSKIFK
jgi:hypothetical protein